MLFLLAQLASPPIQPGPARVPAERAPNQQPQFPSQTDSETTPSITLPSDEPLTPAAEDSSPAGRATPGSSRTVTIVGNLPYSKSDLSELLERCSSQRPSQPTAAVRRSTHRPSAKRWLRELQGVRRG